MLEVTARAGSPLPAIPDDVREALLDWLGVASNTKAITASNVGRIKEFYRSIGWRDWAKPIYRGIGVDVAAARKLLGGGTLQLRPRVAESWSMNPIPPLHFMRHRVKGWSSDVSRIGVLLSKPRPRPGSIIMDAPRFYAAYAGTEHDVEYKGFGAEYIKWMGRQHLGECEMIVEQQCRTCSLDDVEGIVVVLERNSDLEHNELLAEYGFGLYYDWDDPTRSWATDFGRGGALDEIDGDDMGVREQGDYFLRIEGGRLVEAHRFRSSVWPPEGSHADRFRSMYGWRNRPAPLQGDCPRLDLRRR